MNNSIEPKQHENNDIFRKQNPRFDNERTIELHEIWSGIQLRIALPAQ